MVCVREKGGGGVAGDGEEGERGGGEGNVIFHSDRHSDGSTKTAILRAPFVY